MNISFTSSFEKDLKKIRDGSVRKAVLQAVMGFETARSTLEIRGLKKLRTGDYYYRLRLGEYRLGMIIQDDTVKFVRLLHRSDIYRFFP